MTIGTISGNLRIVKQGDLLGDRMFVFYCMNCGFIELYKEASTKEPQRWRTQTAPAEELTSEKPQKPKEPQQEEEPKPKTEKRLVR
jgi:hypothetical protein